MAWLRRESSKKRSASAGLLSTPTKERDPVAFDTPEKEGVAVSPAPPLPHVKRSKVQKRAQRKKINAKTFHQGSVVHDLMRDAAQDLKSSCLSATSVHHAYITCCSASEAVQL